MGLCIPPANVFCPRERMSHFSIGNIHASTKRAFGKVISVAVWQPISTLHVELWFTVKYGVCLLERYVEYVG